MRKQKHSRGETQSKRQYPRKKKTIKLQVACFFTAGVHFFSFKKKTFPQSSSNTILFSHPILVHLKQSKTTPKQKVKVPEKAWTKISSASKKIQITQKAGSQRNLSNASENLRKHYSFLDNKNLTKNETIKNVSRRENPRWKLPNQLVPHKDKPVLINPERTREF